MDSISQNDQMQQYKDKFQKIAKQEKYINFQQFKQLMQQLQYQTNQQEFNQYSHAGAMNLDSFQSLMQKKLKDADTQQGTLDAFRIFDRDRTGWISATQLKHILMNIGQSMNEQEAQDLMTDAGVNIDGQIAYDKFVKQLFQNL